MNDPLVNPFSYLKRKIIPNKCNKVNKDIITINLCCCIHKIIQPILPAFHFLSLKVNIQI